MRAKTCADCAVRKIEEAGAIEEVPATDQTQTTVTGTGDKICCDAAETVASNGARSGAGAALQHGIGQLAMGQQAVLPCAGICADTACAQMSNRLQTMVNAIFMS